MIQDPRPPEGRGILSQIFLHWISRPRPAIKPAIIELSHRGFQNVLFVHWILFTNELETFWNGSGGFKFCKLVFKANPRAVDIMYHLVICQKHKGKENKETNMPGFSSFLFLSFQDFHFAQNSKLSLCHESIFGSFAKSSLLDHTARFHWFDKKNKMIFFLFNANLIQSRHKTSESGRYSLNIRKF